MIKVKWKKVLHYKHIPTDPFENGLSVQEPLLNWMNLGNGTMFRIGAFFVRDIFLNSPRAGLFFGIERVGSYFFALTNKVAGDYVCEKLVCNMSDANILADWINIQIGNDVPQQGEYNERYIKEVEPYGNIGEKVLMPISPEIIE